MPGRFFIFVGHLTSPMQAGAAVAASTLTSFSWLSAAKHDFRHWL
jgi:hypothetical protein